MDDTIKAKYLLSGELEKYFMKKNGFWFFENRMFGGIEGSYDSKEKALISYVWWEESRKEMVEKIKRWHK